MKTDFSLRASGTKSLVCRRNASPSIVSTRECGYLARVFWALLPLVGLVGVFRSCHAAEINVNADSVFPQVVSVNRGDSVRWTTLGRSPLIIASFSGEYQLNLVASNNWSASFQFQTAGTNFYQRLPKHSGIVIVRDWTNAPPAITLNAPQEGDVFNCCGNQREPLPLMATPSSTTNNIVRVEFLSGNTTVATVTNAPYFVRRTDLPVGDHTLIARGIDRAGTTSESAPVHITVREVPAPVLKASLIRVEDQTLVMVSWLEPATLHVMSRGGDLGSLGVNETSATSFSGVRFWIERTQLNRQAFFNIRRRF